MDQPIHHRFSALGVCCSVSVQNTTLPRKAVLKATNLLTRSVLYDGYIVAHVYQDKSHPSCVTAGGCRSSSRAAQRPLAQHSFLLCAVLLSQVKQLR